MGPVTFARTSRPQPAEKTTYAHHYEKEFLGALTRGFRSFSVKTTPSLVSRKILSIIKRKLYCEFKQG